MWGGLVQGIPYNVLHMMGKVEHLKEIRKTVDTPSFPFLIVYQVPSPQSRELHTMYLVPINAFPSKFYPLI
jgi:hypothetical protein